MHLWAAAEGNMLWLSVAAVHVRQGMETPYTEQTKSLGPRPQGVSTIVVCLYSTNVRFPCFTGHK